MRGWQTRNKLATMSSYSSVAVATKFNDTPYASAIINLLSIMVQSQHEKSILQFVSLRHALGGSECYP
jgi:hypothetical protein